MSLAASYVLTPDSTITGHFHEGQASVWIGEGPHITDLTLIATNPVELIDALEAVVADLRAATAVGVVA